MTNDEKLKQRIGELNQQLNLCWMERNQLRERVRQMEMQLANLLGERQRLHAKLCRLLGEPVEQRIDLEGMLGRLEEKLKGGGQ
jgi:chromosome segregation ATPase